MTTYNLTLFFLYLFPLPLHLVSFDYSPYIRATTYPKNGDTNSNNTIDSKGYKKYNEGKNGIFSKYTFTKTYTGSKMDTRSESWDHPLQKGIVGFVTCLICTNIHTHGLCVIVCFKLGTTYTYVLLPCTFSSLSFTEVYVSYLSLCP